MSCRDAVFDTSGRACVHVVQSEVRCGGAVTLAEFIELLEGAKSVPNAAVLRSAATYLRRVAGAPDARAETLLSGFGV